LTGPGFPKIGGGIDPGGVKNVLGRVKGKTGKRYFKENCGGNRSVKKILRVRIRRGV